MGKSPLIWLLRQSRRRLPGILFLTLAQCAQAFLSVMFALGTREVIDQAVAGNQAGFIRGCCYQAAIIAGLLLSLTLMRHLRDRLSADLERDWKRQLLHGLLHGDYAQVSAYHSGELLNRLNNDVSRVNEGLLSVAPDGAAMVIRLTAAVVVLGTLDWKFTLLIVGLGLLVLWLTAWMRRWLKELNQKVSEKDGLVSSFLQEIMEKLLMVQAMDISGQVENRSEVLLKDRYEIQRKRKNVSLFTNTGVAVLSYGAGFLALCWCAFQVLLGQMSYGSLTAVIQLVNQVQAPFVNISGLMPKYIAMLASTERLMELEKIQGEPAPAQDARQLYGAMTAIVGEALSFSYDRDPVFQESGFVLPKGSFAVVTGPSGIGKSTLLKLLLGVFRPENGELYAQLPQGKVPLDRSTRGLFAYVPQGNLLLSGTIRENLTIVNSEATQEEIDQALHISAMDAFLPTLPKGLDTVLGESGAGLSEGQAQRLAIARAVLGGAPILLLDECTSALDAKTERLVLERLKALPGRTCIAVTHRPAAVKICDCRLELADGKLQLVNVQ